MLAIGEIRDEVSEIEQLAPLTFWLISVFAIITAIVTCASCIVLRAKVSKLEARLAASEKVPLTVTKDGGEMGRVADD